MHGEFVAYLYAEEPNCYFGFFSFSFPPNNVLVEKGLAKRNNPSNADEDGGEMIIITRLDRTISFDETRLQMDMTDASRSNMARSVTTGKDDNKEYLAAKGGGDVSETRTHGHQGGTGGGGGRAVIAVSVPRV